MRLATVTHEFDQPIRHINQQASGGSYVSIFTLRLRPDATSRELSFCGEIQAPYLEPQIVSAIEQGLREFAEERKQCGQPVGCLQVSLVGITVHPSDIKLHRFTAAAVMAMREAFAAHETLVDLN